MRAVYKQLLNVVCLTLTVCDVQSASEPRTITDKQKEEIVDHHNKLRRQEGASNMELMTWNERLAETAMLWAKECKYWHRQPLLPLTSDNKTTHYGQNMFASSAGTLQHMKSPLNVWYNEKDNYNYDKPSCPAGKMCGHYTQMVWAYSRQVGCAYHYCDPLKKFKTQKGSNLVCNYIDSQLTAKHKPYEKGPACSRCKSGAGWCSDRLCNSNCSPPGKGCSCAVHCYNCAKVDVKTCRCLCANGWMGVFCTVRCQDELDHCYQYPLQGYCNQTADRATCPVSCGVCKDDPGVQPGQCPPALGPHAHPSSTATTMTICVIQQQQQLMMMMMVLGICNNAAL